MFPTNSIQSSLTPFQVAFLRTRIGKPSLPPLLPGVDWPPPVPDVVPDVVFVNLEAKSSLINCIIEEGDRIQIPPACFVLIKFWRLATDTVLILCRQNFWGSNESGRIPREIHQEKTSSSEARDTLKIDSTESSTRKMRCIIPSTLSRQASGYIPCIWSPT